MTPQRQAYSVSFELLLLDNPLQNLYRGLSVPSQTAGVAVQHVSFIL